VTKVNISASLIDASGAESGGVQIHEYLGAVAPALANQEVRRRLQLVIQAYDLLAAGCRTSAEREFLAEAESLAIFAYGRVFSFGPFQLFPSQRLLLEGNSRVQLGSRAFDILTILVERAGEVVGKDELIARVWPNLFVEDSNLKTQVSGLRRALGDACSGRCHIVTIKGRGYSFVAPVSCAEGPALHGPERRQAGRHNDLYGEPPPREAGPVPVAA